MPLSDFAAKKKVGTTTPSATTVPSSLASFAGKASKYSYGADTDSDRVRFGEDAALVPRNYDSARKLEEENPSAWERISKELMKPVSVVAVTSEQAGKVLGNIAVGDFRSAANEVVQTPSKIGGIVTGTTRRSFIDVYKENYKGAGLELDTKGDTDVGAMFVNEAIPNLLGTMTDIAADPLNFIGGGLTKTGTIAEKATKLKAAGEAIKSDSKLMAQAKALGLTDDLLELGATKAEQVEKGQRALITLMANTRWEKSVYGGARVYDFIDNAAAGIKTTKVAENIGKVFSTKTSDEGFNVVKEHFSNLLAYRNGKVMDDAIALQNRIGTLAADDAKRIVDVVETGKKTGIAEIDDIADELAKNFKEIKSTEEGLGLMKSDIEFYFPHQLKKTTEKMTSWEKVKSLFQRADGSSVDDVTEGFGDARQWSTKLDAAKARKYQGTISEIRDNFGIDFEDNAAVAYARRALGSSKAVTSKEFFDSVKQFGSDSPEFIGVGTKVKELDGIKFSPDVARQIDAYYDAVKPEQLNKALKTFDSVQNWWKAQALTAPGYHIRNMAGNVWNNSLAGVNDPTDYYLAGQLQTGKLAEFTDDAGRVWDNDTLMKAAKQSGVINEGWYAKDIETALASEMGGISANPFSQNFALFRANRAIGSVFENNSRLAHFINKLKGGASIDDAAASVKKYLFDYGDLTWTEKNVFKRAVPFYTWTRKNIPLQLEALTTQTGRVTDLAATKVVNAVESNVEEPNEKYLGDYIKNNIGIRVGTDPKGNTMYFLMGQWIPAAQAIDFLTQPGENFIQSISPFFKTPVELWANQSTFFEDTFGQPSKIERYPGENQSWLGLTMRKKTAYILKNIRILNELDKLNPGSVFGDQDSPSLINRIAPEAGFKAPFGIGHITTSEKRGGRFTPETDQATRVLQMMFGKTSLYDPGFAKQFWLWDTDTKVRELERAIKDAQRDGQKEYAKRLFEELQNVRKSR